VGYTTTIDWGLFYHTHTHTHTLTLYTSPP
jgi:hypothetical protein